MLTADVSHPVREASVLADPAFATTPFLLAMLLLAVAAFGAHIAAALLVYSPTRLVRRLKRPGEPEPKDPVQPFLLDYTVIARTLTIGGLLGTALLANAAFQDGSRPVALVGIGLLAIFFCGMLPAAMAEDRAEGVLLKTLPLLRVMRRLLHWPLVVPLRSLTMLALRALGISDRPSTDPDEIAEEILTAVTDSASENALEPTEKEWIENIVALKDLDLAAIMTPRTDMHAFEDTTQLALTLEDMKTTGHSRYPVYQDTVDNVIGVFYVKDLLGRLLPGDTSQTLTVREVMRTPLFVPETMKADELLAEFIGKRVQLAIVLDEYGGTAGLVTLEDVFEQIVGDISDEHDPAEEEAITVIEANRVLELAGRTRVEDVNHELDTRIPETDEYETVGGYLFSSLGSIPKPGQTLMLDGIEFRILRADDRQIERLRITVLQPTTTENH